LPFTRAWELLAGGALACSFDHISHDERASNWRFGLGAALALSGHSLTHTAFFPLVGAFAGCRQRAGVVGASGVGKPTAIDRPHRGLVGLISYPLYLWHCPLLVFFSIVKFKVTRS
jgi:peptidoglycan/LPS O-acetylase OafA/YrhL